MWQMSAIVSKKSIVSHSDNGVYALIFTSIIFQLCLYLIKKYRYFIKSIHLKYTFKLRVLTGHCPVDRNPMK